MPQTTILEEYIDDFNSNDGIITQKNTPHYTEKQNRTYRRIY